MAGQLDGKRVAILVANGFEQAEMTEPRRALDEAGAQTLLVSSVDDKVRAWNHTDWGDEFVVDLTLEQADANEFDALLIPGGVMSPDKLRMEPVAVEFTRAFFQSQKPVAAICHGLWMLAEAEVARNRTLTSYPAIRTDMINAGADWVDQEVVVDHGLVTSRKPADLPAFNSKMIEEFAEGPHPGQTGPAHVGREHRPQPH